MEDIQQMTYLDCVIKVELSLISDRRSKLISMGIGMYENPSCSSSG